MTKVALNIAEQIAGLPDDPDEWTDENRCTWATARQRAGRIFTYESERTAAKEAAAERAAVRAAEMPKTPRPDTGAWTWPAARKHVYGRSHGRCEAGTVACTGSGEHVHHKRGRGGWDPHNPERLLHVCRACHDWIHGNVALSLDAGWLLKRLGIL